MLKVVPCSGPLPYLVIEVGLADKAGDRDSAVRIRQRRSPRGKAVVPFAVVSLIQGESVEFGRVGRMPRHRA